MTEKEFCLFLCGDVMIGSYEQYRGDLTLMYFLYFNKKTLLLEKIKLIPMKIKKMCLHRASQNDCQWMLKKLNQFSINAQFLLENQELIYKS